jgi:hypothetical protein
VRDAVLAIPEKWLVVGSCRKPAKKPANFLAVSWQIPLYDCIVLVEFMTIA